MKKIFILLILCCFNLTAFAEEELATEQNPMDTATTTIQAPVEQLKFYQKGSQKYYYNKYGKTVYRAHDVNNTTFFYTASGNYIGKTVLRDSTKYYYNGIDAFVGTCDIDDLNCQDKDFKPISAPPFPIVKTTVSTY